MFQADVFSAGIIMCETIARIEADPDILPRTQVRCWDTPGFLSDYRLSWFPLLLSPKRCYPVTKELWHQ